ncbi:hypothetical protein [Aestuariivirga sp.]|uniref:hypothetical protein n=1 Tax=Aestuariivirga sp. TaxID=2650926 RepID=UPI0035942097
MTTTPTVWLDRSAPNYTLNGPGGNDQTGGRGIGLSNGNFLVIWETNIFQDFDGTNRTEIWGEIFDPRGLSISGEIQLAGLPAGAGIDFEKAEIDADDSGGFHMVLVSDTTAAPGGESVLVAHFDDGGTRTSFTPRSTIYGDYGSLSIGDTEEIAITVAPNGDVIIAEKLELDRPFLPPDFSLLAFTTDGTLTVDIDDSTRVRTH